MLEDFGPSDTPVIDEPSGFLSNPYQGADPIGPSDTPVIDQPSGFLSNPYVVDNIEAEYALPEVDPAVFAGNPYKVDPQDLSGMYLVKNPYGDTPDLDTMRDLGMITDAEYAGLQLIMPSHKSEPVEFDHVDVNEHPIVGPSKEEWERYDEAEAGRQAAVDNYKDCTERGDHEGAARWADEAIRCQTDKEAVNSVKYVTDIATRAGLNDLP